MDGTVRKHIVISAVNIRKGGTLTVLRECLSYLSGQGGRFRVTAIVHDRALCDYPGIEYIEIPWSIKGWGRRLLCEYFTLGKISRSFPREVDLWFSLHDTTPRVQARRQAVYCHTSFPFMKATWQDVRMDLKIALFSKLTRYAYSTGVHRNNFLVVQQQWMRDSLSRLIGFPKEKIVVCPPHFPPFPAAGSPSDIQETVFLYPATADCHKNFETLCRASRILEEKVGKGRFRTVLTISGEENKYSRWLRDTFKDVASIDFHGFMAKDELSGWYGKASCLVFPSRIETWGLPISEFAPTGKPLLLADLPYARETASGASKAGFFPPTDEHALAEMMLEVLEGKADTLSPVPPVTPGAPYAGSWDELFNILIPPEK